MSNNPLIINVSLPKTGSNTIACLFAKFGGMHEGLHIKTTTFLINNYNSSDKHITYRNFLFERQKQLNARVDSSTFMHFFLPELLDIWPQSTYLHVLRNPLDWVVSYMYMLTQYAIQLNKSPNELLKVWSNEYLNFQIPELDLRLFPKLIYDEQLIVQVIDKLLIYWHARTHYTHSSINRASSCITTTLGRLNQELSILAAAAEVDLNQLPTIKVNNAAKRDNYTYRYIKDNVYRSSPCLSTFKRSRNLFNELSTTTT